MNKLCKQINSLIWMDFCSAMQADNILNWKTVSVADWSTGPSALAYWAPVEKIAKRPRFLEKGLFAEAPNWPHSIKTSQITLHV